MKIKLLFLLAGFIGSFNAMAQTAYPAPDLRNCEFLIFDLTQQTPIILGNQSLSEVSVGYYLSQADVESGTNQIADPHLFIAIQDTTTIYARVTDLDFGTYAWTDFDAISVAMPELPEIDDVMACDFYMLPDLGPALQYALDPGLTTAVEPGMVFTTSITVYYYINNATCLVSSSFDVYIFETPVIEPVSDVTACDSYLLPPLAVGSYFTGPQGSGSQIFAGEMITQSQMVYVNAMNGACMSEASFMVTILNTPVLDPIPDVTHCESYILPELPFFTNYYTQSGGMGNIIPAGTVITSTTTIFVYGANEFCFNETSFNVIIGIPWLYAPDHVLGCTDGSGTGIFNLQELVDGINGSMPGVSSSVFQTYVDAAQNINPILNLSAYESGPGYIYIRSESTETGCHSIFEIALEFIPCTDNTISGIVRIDENGDGCDDDDPVAANIQVVATMGNDVTYAYTNEQGEYLFSNVLPGTYSLVPVHSNVYLPVSSQFISIENPSNATADFCLQMAPEVIDLGISLYPTTNAQPGFGVSYTMSVQNFGNTSATGIVTLLFDATRLTFVSSFPAGTLNGNILTFNLGVMPPGSVEHFNVNFDVAIPPVAQLGDILTFVAMVAAPGDSVATNDQMEFAQTIVNSFDPNDMNVLEGPVITEAQADDYLHYLIRFQNVGNADAINVRIENTLDTNLDWSTFEPVASSHTYHAERVGGEVTFRYDGIHLPGTNDEPASHGFVAYRIKPVPQFAQGDVIINSAQIFFDFNEPILTNVVSTQIGALSVPDANFGNFVIYPNPASSTMNVSGAIAIDKIEIVDVSGKRIFSFNNGGNEASIDVSALEAGVYFVRIASGNLIETKKLMVR